MKKVIEGKLYNTQTAKEVTSSESHDYKEKRTISEHRIAESHPLLQRRKTPLHFGEDGTYHAYIVHGTCDIPLHYAEVAQFKDKIDIIDDDGFVTCYEANVIRVYRAGEFGCIIQLLDNNK